MKIMKIMKIKNRFSNLELKNLKNLKYDILLLVGILLVGVMLLFIVSKNNNGNYVRIKIDNDILEEFPLWQDRSFDINSGYGENNLIIENGEVWIDRASCPDGLCKNTGKISKKGQAIICLPNHLIIEII